MDDEYDEGLFLGVGLSWRQAIQPCEGVASSRHLSGFKGWGLGRMRFREDSSDESRFSPIEATGLC